MGRAIALTEDGNGQIAVRNSADNTLGMAHIWPSNGEIGWTGYWTQESTSWQTPYNPWLSAAGAFIHLFALAASHTADYNHPAYWKQSGSY